MIDLSDASDLQAREVIEWWREEHIGAMWSVYEVVESAAPSLNLGDAEVKAVSLRSKRFESMIDKLTREPGKLAGMADIGGVRAVVNTQSHVDDLHRRLAQSLDVRRVRDWARKPRSTGYRALHLHVRSHDRIIEVQLRTFGQDAWANAVEEESRRSGINYKAGLGSEAVLEFFRCTAASFGALELGESHPDLAARLHDAYLRARPELTMRALLDLEL